MIRPSEEFFVSHSNMHQIGHPHKVDFFEYASSISDSGSDTSHNQVKITPTTEAKTKNMIVENLVGNYETCISSLRSSQSQRRATSLKRISPANFTKEGSNFLVLEAVIEEIASLNSLDVELYKHAWKIFAKYHKMMEQKLLDSVVPEIQDLDAFSTFKE